MGTEAQEKDSRIVGIVIEDEMKKAYLSYAMSVIVSRALPDVRDGLKPANRRILVAMNDLGLAHNKRFRKSAKICGDVSGNYHPHGESVVYPTLVRMAQPFSMRYPLVDGQGNFGSVDGDPPAAMRYCVTGDSILLTGKGMIKISSISDKKEIKTDEDILSYDGKQNKAIKFFDSGRHKIKSLKTSMGFEIAGSLNHPVLCWKKGFLGRPQISWKLLNEIKTGDYVILQRNHELFSKSSFEFKRYYPKNKMHQNTLLPARMDNRLAYFLGMLVSKGSFHQKNIVFNEGNTEIYNQIKGIIKRLFGVDLHVRKTNEGCIKFKLCHQSIVQFLKNIGFESAGLHHKQIPFSILMSKKDHIASFLRVLYDNDGSVAYKKDKKTNSRHIKITYNSKSKGLIKQIKIVLLNFGIVSTEPYKRKNHYCINITDTESIKSFKEKIGFNSQIDMNLLSKRTNEGSNKTDFVPFLSDYIKNKYNGLVLKKCGLEGYSQLEKNYNLLCRHIDDEDKALIDVILKHRYLFDSVSDVINKGKEKVYSVKVKSNCHSFVANGFINHNTEARLKMIAEEMLTELDKDTVDFVPNYDATMKEPVVLPSRVPNLLVNGSSGIAVGMATNIPPHNISEVASACIEVIGNPDITVEEIMKILPGPDFPTGAMMTGIQGIYSAYQTGRGKIILKAVCETEDGVIIIKELPYIVNKAMLIQEIAELVKTKRIEGIRTIRDESSDRGGMRVVIELKHGADSTVLLNQLYKYSRLKTTFGINMLALVNGKPLVLGIIPFIKNHIKHRKEIVTRRTQYELKKAKERAHVLEGLIIALDNLDKIIPGIKKSRTVAEAKQFLMETYSLTEIQAKAILEMKLQKLASLEQDKIRTEHSELIEIISNLEVILNDESKIYGIIRQEYEEINKAYGDKRRTQIVEGEEEDIDYEELIEEKEMVVTISHQGYIKRIPLETYRTQRRGGVGITGAVTKEEDEVKDLFVASTHSYLLCFTNKGRVHWVKVYRLPMVSRTALGKPIVNFIQVGDETITAIVPVRDLTKEGYLMMATRKGTIKKTPLEAFTRPRKAGIRAVELDEDDELINVLHTTGDNEIILATHKGRAIHFKEETVRAMGRTAHGVRGIRLGEEDYVIGMIACTHTDKILTVTEKGYGKRTVVSDYRLTNRGGRGIINIKITKKNGNVMGVMKVDSEDEIMAMSEHGVIIRVPVCGVAEIGRSTQGVRIMRLKENDKVVGAAKIEGKNI